MTAGRLAAVAPSATTNTVLYSSDINDTTSGVVHICNRGGSAGTYRLAHKDYTQELTLDANTCLLYTSPSPRDRTRSRMPSSA